MQYPIDSAPWRRNFVAALQLLARAALRQPFGPPDPVLCGAAAVRLYTGDLWSAGRPEVFTAAPGTLITELLASGFRWTGRPNRADRGLWHPELQIGIEVIDHKQRGLAQESNTLTVALDLGVTGPADRELVSLKVVGIEDLIVEETVSMWRQRASSEEAMARAYVLAGLGRAGVGGRLRAGYLHRRLAWETRGEVVLEDLWPDRAGEDDAASRLISLTRMQALINAWRASRGFSFDRPRLQFSRERREQGARQMPSDNDEWGRAGGPRAAAANVIPLEVAQVAFPE
jgi:hypothetical protein